MKGIAAIICAMALSVLAGCASQGSSSDGVTVFWDSKIYVKNGATHASEALGAGAQWNENYVVTADHVKMPPKFTGKSFACSFGCDMKFVEKKLGAGLQWRSPVAGENISANGFRLISSIDGKKSYPKKASATGKDIGIKIFTAEVNQKEWLNVAAMKTTVGMSGGPILADDGKAVGILVGAVALIRNGTELSQVDGTVIGHVGKDSDIEENVFKEYALYVPYDIIKQEWEIAEAAKVAKAPKT